jgi:hypothetical protein
MDRTTSVLGGSLQNNNNGVEYYQGSTTSPLEITNDPEPENKIKQ